MHRIAGVGIGTGLNRYDPLLYRYGQAGHRLRARQKKRRFCRPIQRRENHSQLCLRNGLSAQQRRFLCQRLQNSGIHRNLSGNTVLLRIHRLLSAKQTEAAQKQQVRIFGSLRFLLRQGRKQGVSRFLRRLHIQLQRFHFRPLHCNMHGELVIGIVKFPYSRPAAVLMGMGRKAALQRPGAVIAAAFVGVGRPAAGIFFKIRI